jgi:hypothetical protein
MKNVELTKIRKYFLLPSVAIPSKALDAASESPPDVQKIV